MPDIFIEKEEKPKIQKVSTGQPRIVKTSHRVRASISHAGAPEIHHARHSMFPLAAFAMDPKGVSFATQGDGEEIHHFLRRHLITNIPWIVFSALLLVLPLIIGPFLFTTLPLSS